MKHTAEQVLQIASIAASVYETKLRITPAMTTTPEMHRQCVVEAVNLLEMTAKVLSEIEDPPQQHDPSLKAKAEPAKKPGTKR